MGIFTKEEAKLHKDMWSRIVTILEGPYYRNLGLYDAKKRAIKSGDFEYIKEQFCNCVLCEKFHNMLIGERRCSNKCPLSGAALGRDQDCTIYSFPGTHDMTRVQAAEFIRDINLLEIE